MDLPKLITGRAMAEVDRRTLAEAGISSAELIERAGAEVVAAIAARWDGLAGLQAVVLCGKGHNGGDGLAAARLLHGGGGSARVFLAADRTAMRGAAAEHLQRCEQAGCAVEVLGADLAPLDAALRKADLAIDALLGTGLRGAPRPAMARVIECLAQCARPVVAVDIPSGVEADSGRVDGAAVQAVLTVTFGLVKVGHLFYPGRAHCGALHLANIGFPEPILRDATAPALLLAAEGLGPLVPRRRGDEHKGSCGTAVVIAGSVGMTGAAALTADAALRSGAGRVHLGVPASLNDIVEVKLSEVMTRPLPEVRKRRCLSLRALGEVQAMLTRADVLALGPGLGRYRETAELVRRLVLRTEQPLVLDADGLSAFAGRADALKARSARLVLTPHVGEFARLSGLDKQQIAAAPMAVARDFAGEFGATLVLKGAPTVVALADGRMAVNPTGNAGMATAGAGDVLTGVIAGLMAQGLGADEAACLGVYVHGLAGDRAAERLGEWGMRAGDIADEIALALVDAARSA